MKSLGLSQKNLNIIIATVFVLSAGSFLVYEKMTFKKCVQSYHNSEETKSIMESLSVTPEAMCRNGYDVDKLYREAVHEYTMAEGFGESFDEKMEDIGLILEWKIVQIGNK